MGARGVGAAVKADKGWRDKREGWIDEKKEQRNKDARRLQLSCLL